MSCLNCLKIFYTIILIFHTTRAAYLRCYQGSITAYKEVPLEDSDTLIEDGYINPSQDLITVVHGYNQDIEGIQSIIIAYQDVSTNTKNLCALNWMKEASAFIAPVIDPIKLALGVKFLAIDYPAVSAIAGQVGKKLGEALVEMKHSGLDMDKVYLIGHSEGAHLSGAAGREVISSGLLIGRITALDPAKPHVEKGLDKTCAKLVDVIHTNPQQLGSDEEIGHIDFWPNYGCPVQPGCKLITKPASEEYLCSHERSVKIMADAITYQDSLQGRRADSYYKWKNAIGTPDAADINVIGALTNSSKTGSFYLCTKAESVYGEYEEGTSFASCSCTTS